MGGEMEQIRSLSPDEVRRGRPKGAVAKIRAVHHLVAQLYAKGMKPTEIAPIVNRTSATVRNWLASPANQELVAQYCKEEHGERLSEADYTLGLMRRARTLSLEQIVEQLEAAESGDSIPLSKLLAVMADTADRTGIARQTVSLNINADLGARLDRARERVEQVIEGRNVVKLERRRF